MQIKNLCNQYNQTNQWFRQFTNSNRIQKIDDVSQFDPQKDVKHFYDITNAAATDFSYDNNANITEDNNKSIITKFNFLNLPLSINKKGSNNLTIDYLYDATGNKLQTIEGPTTTDYINGIQYTNGNLAAIATAEGRVRPKTIFANNPTAFVYDYYIKDHLGNVRVTITEEDDRDYYMATMEAQNDATERTLFDNVPQTRYDIPYTYPPDSTYTPNNSISRLNGQDSTTIGHAKILQVRPGDNLTFDTKYFYHDSMVTYNAAPINTIINQLTNIIAYNGLAGSNMQSPEMVAWINDAFTYGLIGNFLTNTFNQNSIGSPEAPQAYLVYLTLDEGFGLIESKSGMLQATSPEELGELAVANLHIENNGFVYIYVNNNSSYAVNFDNLRIAHKLASVMEVNNYYPYGLLNSSLSYSRSGNRYKYQTKEVDNYMDYNILDFGARHYDAATARWTAYDPASQYATPYISMGGNPVSGIDPTGTVSHRLSDAQASVAAACASIEYLTNGNKPIDYSMWSNVSSAGGGGGQTYFEIGLQTGSTSMTMYQDARGNFYANANSASNATGISYNDIMGMSGGDKLYQYCNENLGAHDAKGHGAHQKIISQLITGSYNIDVNGLSIKQYTGDVTWKFGNEDAPEYENNLFSYTERFERKFRNSGPWGVITTTKYSSVTTGDALINITRTRGNSSTSITGSINHSYGPLKGTLDSNTNLSISFGGISTGFGPEGITLGFSSTVHNLEIGSEFTFMPNENFLNAAIFVGCIVQPELTPFLIK